MNEIAGEARPAGVKPARQKRAEETRDKLVAALEKLLRDKPFDAISVAEIAKRAGLSVGAVYRRFENKDAFIPVLMDIYKARLLAHFGEAGGPSIDPSEGLRSALRQLTTQSWEFLSQEAPILRAAHLHSRLRPDLIGEEWDELLAASMTGFGQLARAFPEEVKRADLDKAGEMLAYHFNTALIEKALYPAEGAAAQMTVDGLDFADAIADFAYGYLITPDDKAED